MRAASIGDREFWMIVRAALIAVVRGIEKRWSFSPADFAGEK